MLRFISHGFIFPGRLGVFSVSAVALATLIAIAASLPAAAQTPPPNSITPLDPNVLEQQKILPQANPADEMDRLMRGGQAARLRKWLGSLPLDDTARARARTGKMQRYRVQLGGIKKPGIWTGLLLLTDWRKDEAVDLNKFYGRGGKPNWWRRDRSTGNFYKWLRGADGKQKGVLVVDPRNGFAVALDLDGDKSIDLMGAVDFNYNTDWIVSSHIKDLMDAQQGSGLDGLCGPLGEDVSLGAGDAGSGQEAGDVDLGALDICGNNSGSAGGGGGSSGSAGAPGFGASDSIGDICKSVLAAGPPKGGGGPGIASDDPYWSFDWDAAAAAFEAGGSDVATKFGPLGRAANLAAKIGDALRAGVPEPVNAADWAVRRYEEAGVRPGQDLIQDACAGGSTSNYCNQALAPPPSQESTGDGGGGGGGGNGGSEPIPGEGGGGSWNEMMYDRCLARAKTANAWGTSQENAAPANDCGDPVTNPGGSASADGGKGAMSCGGSNDGGGEEGEEGQARLSDVMGAIGAVADSCQPDEIGANKCEPSMGGPSRRRRSIGISIGAVLGMDCSANPACDPSSPY